MCCDPHDFLDSKGLKGLENCKVVIIKGGGHCHFAHGSECCCPDDTTDCCHPRIQRHFISKAEKLEHLEQYRDQISKELAGIEEAIAKAKED